VSLNPGETRNIIVKLDRRAFSYYDVKSHSWTVAPGDFDLFVARSAADIALTGKVALHESH
jgi:beta-glucosidase